MYWIRKLKIDATLGTCLHMMLDENIIAIQSSLCTWNLENIKIFVKYLQINQKIGNAILNFDFDFEHTYHIMK
jgi:hypothetical protein